MSSTPTAIFNSPSTDSFQHVADGLRRLASRITRHHRGPANHLATMQADHLLRRAHMAGLAADDYIAGLTGLHVERHQPMPVPAISFRRDANDLWVIHLRGNDSRPEQRFALVHEFKRILDRPMLDTLYSHDEHIGPFEGALAADLFADRCLVPEAELRTAVRRGLTEPGDVAEFFGCTEAVAQRRLALMRGPSRAHAEPGVRR